ncbi:hypothetical protein AC1031_005551 [Aphanomyces cochlioides]|nr:hypothetical protein AC1031_005551 [Aphanomyces cochlioides]
MIAGKAAQVQQTGRQPDQLEWYGGQINHPGPCEVWCDDELVVPFNTNCAATYPTGIIPYDKAKCVGKTLLTLYWMSTLLEWQVYTDCAHIGNGITPTSIPMPAIPPTMPTSTSHTPTIQTTSTPQASSPPPSSSAPTSSPTNSPTIHPTPTPSNSTTPKPTRKGKKRGLNKQCGGDHYTGSTECKDGLVCHKVSDSYSKCIKA